MNTYKKGRRGEKRAGEKLRKRGHNYIHLSPGSRGPWDVRSTTPSGNIAYTQVKSGTASMSSKAKRKLKRYAEKRGAIAMYARENRGRVRIRVLANYAKKKRHRH